MSTAKEKSNHWLLLVEILIVAVVLGLRLGLLYWSLFSHHPLIPPGDDPAVHLQIMRQLAAGTFTFGSYPPGYHLLMLKFAQLLGAAPVTVVTVGAPILVGGLVIGSYLLARSWFGRWSALITAALIGLTAIAPILSFVDGNYPEILASGFLFPLGLLFLTAGLRAAPVRNAVLASAVFLGVAVVHHLTFGIILLVVPLFLLLLFILERKRVLILPFRGVVTAITLCGFTAAAFVALRAAGSGVFLPILRDVLNGNATAFLSSIQQAPLSFSEYPDTLGGFIWFGGVLGIIWIITQRDVPLERRLLLLLWASVIFTLSRTSHSGLPARFTRDLVMPLGIAAGALVSNLVTTASSRSLRLLLAGSVAVMFLYSTAMFTQGPFQAPNGLNRMIWFDALDDEKLAALETLPKGSRILATPSSRYYEVLLNDRVLSVLPYEVTADPTLAAATIQSRADYLFIGTLPVSNSDIRTYPYFSEYDSIHATLTAYPNVEVVRTFADGTNILKVKRILPTGSSKQ